MGTERAAMEVERKDVSEASFIGIKIIWLRAKTKEDRVTTKSPNQGNRWVRNRAAKRKGGETARRVSWMGDRTSKS